MSGLRSSVKNAQGSLLGVKVELEKLVALENDISKEIVVAQDILTKLKQEQADVLSQIKDAKDQAETIVAQAQAKADEIAKDANDQAQAKLETANAVREKILADTEVLANELNRIKQELIEVTAQAAAEEERLAAFVVFREQETMVPPPQAAEDPLAPATVRLDNWNNELKDGRAVPQRPKPEEERPPNNGTPFDQEARELVKKIEEARDKVKKILSK
jgi:cell division septum initiation protein DivIVA